MNYYIQLKLKFYIILFFKKFVRVYLNPEDMLGSKISNTLLSYLIVIFSCCFYVVCVLVTSFLLKNDHISSLLLDHVSKER